MTRRATSPERPPVTVLIATRDRLVLLAKALDRIFAQDYAGDLHVVCVFDGPIPESHGLAAPSQQPGEPLRTLTVTSNAESPGLAGARNHGLGMARSDLVALCDDDDLWHVEKVRRQVALAQERPDAVCIGGGIRVLSGDDVIERPAPTAEVTFADLLQDRIMELHPSTMLLRAGVLRDIGGWDEALPGGYAEDYDLLLRLAKRGPIVLVDHIVTDILWAGQSAYFSRWAMIAAALEHLLDKFPEFEQAPRGRARIRGQIAFALAASGQREEARVQIRRTRQDRLLEPRATLAQLVGGRPARAEVIQRALHARGRGI